MIDPTLTDASEVLLVLSKLRAAGCKVWVGGGWGVDVLLGRQTRAHHDLDLAVDRRDLDRALQALAGLGYRTATDWLPVRVQLHRYGRGRVDLHPVAFGEHGDGVQAGLDGQVFRYPGESLVDGWLDGRHVPCLDGRLQRAFREGYELRDVDRHDLALLDELRSRSATL